MSFNRSLNTERGEWTLTFPASLPAGANDWKRDLAREADVTMLDLTGYGVAQMPDGTIKAGKALAEPDVRSGDLFDIGLCYLALARYRRENPPVDEAQVEAMTSSLAQWGVQTIAGAPVERVARDLIAAGWSK